MSAVSERARDLHAKHHTDSSRLTCSDCRTAARAMLYGRTPPPRSRRSGEEVTDATARDLLGTRHLGRIIGAVGHRGYLWFAEETPEGGIHVVSSNGVCTYSPNHPFAIWGP